MTMAHPISMMGRKRMSRDVSIMCVSFQEDGSDSAADRVALSRLSENPVKCRVFRKPPL
jgi:hypothetical protein